ncbi:hypothetical protein ACFPTO_02190 [Paraburkholderia denitrificans]|uniref:Uncharacterized protein n=1 Tax=Paraburkholderia denitrificans TaxID=694025 RepID=A0ABW0J3Q6_9BURK
MSKYQDEFPVLGSNGWCVPMAAVRAHAHQCQINHGQSPERLRERGGLSWCELHAVLMDRSWRKLSDVRLTRIGVLDLVEHWEKSKG